MAEAGGLVRRDDEAKSDAQIREKRAEKEENLSCPLRILQLELLRAHCFDLPEGPPKPRVTLNDANRLKN